MATHAILITYRNLEKNNTELINKARRKYASFKELYFDSGWVLIRYLIQEVREIPKTDRLKIYISGHGGTGQQYITDNAGNRKQTVEDLAIVLAYGLEERQTSPQTSANTEVNMFSCFFGRTPDVCLDGCPAVCLHKMLTAKGVYVDLVARTESLRASGSAYRGRVTASLLRRNIDIPEHINKYDKAAALWSFLPEDMRAEKLREMDERANVRAWWSAKTPFTKIRCTYRNGAAVVLLRDYDKGRDAYINSMDLQGKRILWADYVINKLVAYITPTGEQTGVTDPRHKKVYETVKHYDAAHDPELLKNSLMKLKTEFSTHRNVFSRLTFELPKTARLITDLLSEYPG
jgi:hypothetical protein